MLTLRIKGRKEKEARVPKATRAPRDTKVTREAKAPKGIPPLPCYMAARMRPKEARSKFLVYLLCCRYLTSHSGSSDTVAHLFLLSLHTLHHLSSPFITFHHIPSHSHLHSIHRLLTFHYLLHRFVSSWSFRPARYVLPHSYLPHTHTTPKGISLVIPAHQIPLTLYPFIVCSSLTAIVISLLLLNYSTFPISFTFVYLQLLRTKLGI